MEETHDEEISENLEAELARVDEEVRAFKRQTNSRAGLSAEQYAGASRNFLLNTLWPELKNVFEGLGVETMENSGAIDELFEKLDAFQRSLIQIVELLRAAGMNVTHIAPMVNDVAVPGLLPVLHRSLADLAVQLETHVPGNVEIEASFATVLRVVQMISGIPVPNVEDGADSDGGDVAAPSDGDQSDEPEGDGGESGDADG